MKQELTLQVTEGHIKKGWENSLNKYKYIPTTCCAVAVCLMEHFDIPHVDVCSSYNTRRVKLGGNTKYILTKGITGIKTFDRAIDKADESKLPRPFEIRLKEF